MNLIRWKKYVPLFGPIIILMLGYLLYPVQVSSLRLVMNYFSQQIHNFYQCNDIRINWKKCDEPSAFQFNIFLLLRIVDFLNDLLTLGSVEVNPHAIKSFNHPRGKPAKNLLKIKIRLDDCPYKFACKKACLKFRPLLVISPFILCWKL